MGTKTGIAWTDATWNPIRGCTKVSKGCEHCYAMGVAYRFKGPGQPYEGLAKLTNGRPNWTGVVREVPEHLMDPLRWATPRRVFVNSMSDLFHPGVRDAYIAAVFAIMALAPQHQFQVLTKRPERMQTWVNGQGAEHTRQHVRYLVDRATLGPKAMGTQAAIRRTLAGLIPRLGLVAGLDTTVAALTPWPLPNVWLGTSVEDQDAADERIPHLMQTPAAIHFLSCEPLLGPVQLWKLTKPYHQEGFSTPREVYPLDGLFAIPDHDWPAGAIGWVIVGGESGPGHRPMDLEWARSLRDTCVEMAVPFFFKQWGGPTAKSGGKLLDGREWNEMPEVAP